MQYITRIHHRIIENTFDVKWNFKVKKYSNHQALGSHIKQALISGNHEWSISMVLTSQKSNFLENVGWSQGQLIKWLLLLT